jgi:4-amino-4-deoxy-L-arabinose transferase-like glycosyltransferase
MVLESLVGVLRRWSDRRLLLVMAAVYVALAAGSSLTKRPWSDEGSFASPGYNLAMHGYMGTAGVSEENSRSFQGLSRHTYWIMPLTMVNQAGWYKLFGFSLFSMRSLSTFYGLLAMLCCYALVRKLTANWSAALVAAFIVATDFVVVSAGSMGRPDMMCAALGLAAWTCYLLLREKRFGLALLLSHALVAASGLSHPNGILYLVGLLLLMIWFDLRRLGWKQLVICAVPYVGGGIAYGLYILQSPSDFMAQFVGNAKLHGRLSSFSSPLSAIAREVTDRYMTGFGLGTHEPGHSGPIFLKSLVLLVYVAGAAGALSIHSLRRVPGVRLLLLLFGVVSVILTFLDGLKYTLYLVHTVPLLAMLLALALCWLWGQNAAGKWLAFLTLAGLVALQAGGSLLRMKQNTYETRYAPAARFLRSACSDAALVMGSIEFWFDSDFDNRLLDDPYLGYYNHKQPGCIVVDDIYDIAFDSIARENPSGIQHIQQTLQRYRKVYDYAGFRIYRRP